MLICGLYNSHDTSFAILENGKTILHVELERYIRQKQPIGDAFQLLMNDYPEFKKIKYFVEILDPTHQTQKKTPYAHQMIKNIVESNGGEYYVCGHHQSHAANAFYSSNFKDALIVTIDGGGRDIIENVDKILTSTTWIGKDNNIQIIKHAPETQFNIGSTWNIFTTNIFGLSGGWPKGDQAGSVMAMACMGDPNKYYDDVASLRFERYAYWNKEKIQTFNKLAKIANESEQNKFDIAAALQKYTEDFLFTLIGGLLKETKQRNICLSGGVALNSVMVGKLYSVFEKEIDNIYVCPVPYDAGLCIGAAQYVWHQVLGNDRIEHINNSSPYLGIDYTKQQILDSLNLYDNTLTYEKRNQTHVLGLLSESKIVSLFCGKSESGRRALGNRSIIADPRNPEMKDTINQKVKHRQWYRPFAPSIMREHVSEWFVKDIDSPYMSKVINFKPEMGKKVPAVNHFNGSARLQTVTEQDNKFYYNLLKEWNEISGVPILLNTSFNDREPIVETPNDAIKCFLNTDIDHLYFLEYELLVSKK